MSIQCSGGGPSWRTCPTGTCTAACSSCQRCRVSIWLCFHCIGFLCGFHAARVRTLPGLIQVVTSIQSCDPAIDGELAQLSADRRPGHDPKQYCMLPGRLFSAAPAALGFVVCLNLARAAHRFTPSNPARHAQAVGCDGSCGAAPGCEMQNCLQVRQACCKHTTGVPALMCYSVKSQGITTVLNFLNQVADLALKLPGLLACLVQGIGRYEQTAGAHRSCNALSVALQDLKTCL